MSHPFNSQASGVAHDIYYLYTGFVRGLKNLKSFGNLNLLVPGLEVLEIWENPIKSYGYWHFGHGDFIFHINELNRSVSFHFWNE
jgi:hypothetical protein